MHHLSLERHVLRRDDPDWLAECLASPRCRVLVRDEYRYPVDEHGCITLLSKQQADELASKPLTFYFLGEIEIDHREIYIFTTTIQEPLANDLNWSSLRNTSLDDPLASLVFYAQGLLNWVAHNRYCHRCGAELITIDGGNRQLCKDNDCGIEIFPRINPAVIVLLTHGNQCLLANAHRFKGNIPMHSCLAGYMETGEDFEQTLRREVYEEVGLELADITYKGNQPWPFPQSLMIGFHAESISQATTFHDGEIASARWFTAEELKDAVLNKDILLPTPKSISYYLIEDWFESHHDTSLRAIINEAADES